jgi:hypothetical protein
MTTVYINKGGRFGLFLVSDGQKLFWSKTQATVFFQQDNGQIYDRYNRIICVDGMSGEIYYSNSECFSEERWKLFGYSIVATQNYSLYAVGMSILFTIILLAATILCIYVLYAALHDKSGSFDEIMNEEDINKKYFRFFGSYVGIPIGVLALFGGSLFACYYFISQAVYVNSLTDPLV